MGSRAERGRMKVQPLAVTIATLLLVAVTVPARASQMDFFVVFGGIAFGTGANRSIPRRVMTSAADVAVPKLAAFDPKGTYDSLVVAATLANGMALQTHATGNAATGRCEYSLTIPNRPGSSVVKLGLPSSTGAFPDWSRARAISWELPSATLSFTP